MAAPTRSFARRHLVGSAFVVVVVAIYPLLFAIAWIRVGVDSHRTSRSIGTPASGRLVDGHVIPPSGPGFTTYSYLGAALGRQYVNGAVRDTLLETFAALHRDDPDRLWVMGETGWPHGGRIRPHRTHENGMSVDVFVPVVDDRGRPARIGTWPWNEFGYGVEFDRRGTVGSLRIDFEALARFLSAVERNASRHHLRLHRIILAPEFVPLLLATSDARQNPAIRTLLIQRPAWVRHDEHVHLDFE